MTTITRERAQEIFLGNGPEPTASEERELARIALASLDAKPVYFVEIEGDQDINAGRVDGKERFDLGLLPDGINYLYANPPVVNSAPIYTALPLTDTEREELLAFRRAACNHGFPPGAHTQGVIGCEKCAGRRIMIWELPEDHNHSFNRHEQQDSSQ